VYWCDGCGADRTGRYTADRLIDFDENTEFVIVPNLNIVDWHRIG
jgi:hypothetical protein